jgi:hypothetical protein
MSAPAPSNDTLKQLKICERLNAVCCRCQVQASLAHSSEGAVGVRNPRTRCTWRPTT